MTPCAESKSPMVLAVGWKVCSAKVEKTLLVTHVSWVTTGHVQGRGGAIPAHGDERHVGSQLGNHQLPLARV